MISVIAHELEEAATDPDGKTWYARTGYENGDDCAWTFGTSYQVANGSYANMKLGTRDFLIQRNVKFVGSSQYLRHAVARSQPSGTPAGPWARRWPVGPPPPPRSTG